MNTIWKFELELEREPTVDMPIGARVLSVGTQGTSFDRKLVVWAHVPDSTAKTEERHFFVLGTGNDIPWRLEESTFIGTVQMGALVWHVWDQRKEQRPLMPGERP